MGTSGFQKPVTPADFGGKMGAPSVRKQQVAVEPMLRKLYLASALHGFSDACAKLSTPGFVMEMFGTDFVAASAFFALVNSGQSIAEFLLNPLLGSLSDRFGRSAFLMAWPPINTVSRMIVVLYPTRGVVLAQQIFVKMLEYTFEPDDSDGDRAAAGKRRPRSGAEATGGQGR